MLEPTGAGGREIRALVLQKAELRAGLVVQFSELGPGDMLRQLPLIDGHPGQRPSAP